MEINYINFINKEKVKMIMVQELENLTNDELKRLVEKESLNRFIYIQFPNREEFKKAGCILLDEKLPFNLLGYRAYRISKIIAQYLKRIHGFDFYETQRAGELIERYHNGLVK